MSRKVLVLTLISLLVLSVSVFGAMKPKVDDIMRKRLERMENQNYPDESIVTKYVTTPAPKLLGPMPSNFAGFTYYDYQHNDVQRRMIANGTDAISNIHVTWMDLPAPPVGEERYVDYNSYALGAWLVAGGMHVTQDGQRGGYTGLDLLPDQREVLCYHRTQPETPPLLWGTAISIEIGDPGDGNFASYDIPDSVSGSALKGEWPTVACAKVTSSPSYIHITSAEGQTSGSADKAMYYVRCYEASSSKLICESPGWAKTDTITKAIKHAPNKICYQYDKCRLGTGVIATSPVSQKVAIVYYRNYASSQNQNELMYIESPDNGQSWIDNPATMVPVQLTNYQAAGAVDRAYDDIAVIYDYNDNLHIMWTTFNSTNSNDVTLWHWTASQGARKAGFAAAASSTDPGAWCLLIAKFTLGIYQPDQTLYFNYTKFKDGDISDGGFANGDICAKGSTNFGLTWGPEVNMTNTPGPNGCLAGTCKSEHWSSLAENVDDYLHVEYIADLDPAGVATPEGTMQNDTVIYMKYPRFTIPALASLTYTPTSMIEPMRWAKNGSTTSDSMSFDNVGTSTLYVRLSGPLWLTINPSLFNIVEAGPTQKVNLTLSGAGYSDTILVDSIMIESNDGLVGEVYTNVKWVKIHFVVTDTFYYAEYDTVTQGYIRSTVSNVGNIGNQEDSNMMNYRGHDFLFDFSHAFVTDIPGYGKKGYTWLHEHHDFLPEQHLIVEKFPNLKITTARGVFAPINNRLAPPWHFFWDDGFKIWCVIKIVECHVEVLNIWITPNPRPRWWPYISPPSSTPDSGYVGIVGDWDVPAEASGRNLGGYEDSLNLIWQKCDSAGFTNYYGGFVFKYAAIIKGSDTTEYTKPFGAHVLNNAEQLYPWRGYNDDSLWKYMSMPGWSEGSDSAQDMNIVMTSVHVPYPDSTTVIFEQLGLVVSDEGLDSLRDKARLIKLIETAGDANLDGKVSVSDVVYLINYLFKGGPDPAHPISDPNGDAKISVSDVVYLINYLFKGGPPPQLVWWRQPPW